MTRVLLEDTFDFKPDRSKITESKDPVTGLVTKKIPGTLSVCDTINGNRRRYGKNVWEKNLSEGSILRQMLQRRSSFGLLEHPKDGKVDLTSPISHITTEARLAERDSKWVVEGTIQLVNTVEGQKLTALIDAGYDPLVSSRGYGTLVKDSEGIDDVQDDYVCEGWDVVSTPSFTQAQLTPQRVEKTQESKPGMQTLAAGIAPSIDGLKVIGVRRLPEGMELTLEDGSILHPTKISAPTPSSDKANKQPTFKHMDIVKIRESIQSLKAVNPVALDARNFALGFQQMSELHNAAAKALSENASASWEVSQLHREISAIEETWAAAFEAPKAKVKELTENQLKLLKVLKGVTAHSVKVRESLSESIKKSNKTTEVAEALAKRGRSWMEAARREAASRRLNEKKYGVACEALDLMAGRYKGDVAELGGRVLELEFPDMEADEKKSLSEAKTPKAVVAVRSIIEKKKGKGKQVAGGKGLSSDVDGKKLKSDVGGKGKKNESEEKVETKTGEKLDESKTPAPEETTIFRQDVAVVGVSESISMVRRLSQGKSVFHS